MSLYHEAAEFLTGRHSHHIDGSLKSRIFHKKYLKTPPAQIYALVIETCKWSSVLTEVVDRAALLATERKVGGETKRQRQGQQDGSDRSQLTPALSLVLVHDLLLAKRGGIALPATHALRASVERHKARVQAEFTKARIRRNIASLDAFRSHVEAGGEECGDGGDSVCPRWIRINTLKTTLEDQLKTTFARYERVESMEAVGRRGAKCVYVDEHVPNLVALPSDTSLARSQAYKKGEIIFQDKASCFPAYLLNPSFSDGLILDTCAAPGNKTTHLLAILHSDTPPNSSTTIHAFEKNKMRAATLEKMVGLAGAGEFVEIHAGQDFLHVKPESTAWKNVGALLLDPSCSGSGIVGRDEMPALHLPTSARKIMPAKPHGQVGIARRTEARKRKRDGTLVKAEKDVGHRETMVDDDGATSAIPSAEEYNARLKGLSTFQLELILHAFKFPGARKVTYSTCSVHAEENEHVVVRALGSAVAKERGWRVLERREQVDGLRRWNVRGVLEECGGDELVAQACVRTNKGDAFGTMGFFVVGFVRDGVDTAPGQEEVGSEAEEEEWEGFGDDNGDKAVETAVVESSVTPVKQVVGGRRPRTFLGTSGRGIKGKKKCNGSKKHRRLAYY